MPRTKEQDAARKKAAYHTNAEYRERHKQAMRLKYHAQKAASAAAALIQNVSDEPMSESSGSESSQSESSQSESGRSESESSHDSDSTYMSS